MFLCDNIMAIRALAKCLSAILYLLRYCFLKIYEGINLVDLSKGLFHTIIKHIIVVFSHKNTDHK